VTAEMGEGLVEGKSRLQSKDGRASPPVLSSATADSSRKPLPGQSALTLSRRVGHERQLNPLAETRKLTEPVRRDLC
jgi:hypothetical protein